MHSRHVLPTRGHLVPMHSTRHALRTNQATWAHLVPLVPMHQDVPTKMPMNQHAWATWCPCIQDVATTWCGEPTMGHLMPMPMHSRRTNQGPLGAQPATRGHLVPMHSRRTNHGPLDAPRRANQGPLRAHACTIQGTFKTYQPGATWCPCIQDVGPTRGPLGAHAFTWCPDVATRGHLVPMHLPKT